MSSRVALIIGGSRGIGAAICKRLAADGFDIALTYGRSTEAAEAVRDEIVEKTGRKVLLIQADAAAVESADKSVQQTMDEFGRLDVLVNNAATFIMKPVTEITLEDYDTIANLNIRSVVLTAAAASKVMEDNGRIITIGSVNGDRMPVPGGSLYSMTKSAVKALAWGWSRDLGPRGITVNTVQPGPIDTEMNPADSEFAEQLKPITSLGRYGKVEEVAALVSFVASPEAGYITGATLDVDGGFNA